MLFLFRPIEKFRCFKYLVFISKSCDGSLKLVADLEAKGSNFSTLVAMDKIKGPNRPSYKENRCDLCRGDAGSNCRT